MATEKKGSGEAKAGVSRMQLALGAASLFLFIVGLKRSFRVEGGPGTPPGAARGPADGDGRTDTARAG